MQQLGVVSFLNARPLIDGLDESRGVQCVLDVPSALPAGLERGDFDAALIPIVDVLRSAGRFRVVSDACIGCDGETMTVRVFSQVPPDRIRTLWIDPDSHTSVALARILWRELYVRDLTLKPLDPRGQRVDELEAVLLIGDKVVDPQRGSFAYEVDLGGAWRQHTGLPFVFAVWAHRGEVAAPLAELLSSARDRGVAKAAQIAESEGPRHGWPVELAHRYLTRCLKHKLDGRTMEGVNLFARYCASAELVARGTAIPWPAALLGRAAGVAV
jgi:chorismate dehydratase